MSLIGLSFCRPLSIIAAYSMIGLGSMTLHHLCCTGVRDLCHHTSYFIRIIYYNANSVTCSDVTRPKSKKLEYQSKFQYFIYNFLGPKLSIQWISYFKFYEEHDDETKVCDIKLSRFHKNFYQLSACDGFWSGRIKLLRQLEYYSRVIVIFIIIFVGNSLKKD